MSITPDQFLTQPSDPDEDTPFESVDLTSLIASIDRNVALLVMAAAPQRYIVNVEGSGFAREVSEEQEVEQGYREAHADLEAKYESLFGLVSDIEKVVAKSTSKLAKEVKASIQFWKTGAVVESELAPEIVPDERCSGGSDCVAALHEHGCYADVKGNACTDPEEHVYVHNHAWERTTEGALACVCGAWIDESDPNEPNGIVREPSDG